jgi:hypothetical protein
LVPPIILMNSTHYLNQWNITSKRLQNLLIYMTVVNFELYIMSIGMQNPRPTGKFNIVRKNDRQK